MDPTMVWNKMSGVMKQSIVTRNLMTETKNRPRLAAAGADDTGLSQGLNVEESGKDIVIVVGLGSVSV